VVGPDLAGVTIRRERAWLVQYLRAPDKMLAAQDPIAVALSVKYKNVPMPNLRLGDGEIAMVLSYLESQERVSPERTGQDTASSR
jgi:protein SCO1/2